MIKDNLSRLAEITLHMASVIERDGENGDYAFPRKLGCGHLALTRYMREGIKALIDLQNEVAELKSKLWYREESEKYMREFLRDIFGREDADEFLNDEEKQKIKDLAASFCDKEDEE